MLSESPGTQFELRRFDPPPVFWRTEQPFSARSRTNVLNKGKREDEESEEGKKIG